MAIRKKRTNKNYRKVDKKQELIDKQQERVSYLETTIKELRLEADSYNIEIDELRSQLNSSNDWRNCQHLDSNGFKTAIATLGNRISDLERDGHHLRVQNFDQRLEYLYSNNGQISIATAKRTEEKGDD